MASSFSLSPSSPQPSPPRAVAPATPHSGSSTSSLSLVLMDGATQAAHYGRITFDVSTTATDVPEVGLRCYQGSNWVFDAYVGYFLELPVRPLVDPRFELLGRRRRGDLQRSALLLRPARPSDRADDHDLPRRSVANRAIPNCVSEDASVVVLAPKREAPAFAGASPFSSLLSAFRSVSDGDGRGLAPIWWIVEDGVVVVHEPRISALIRVRDPERVSRIASVGRGPSRGRGLIRESEAIELPGNWRA